MSNCDKAVKIAIDKQQIEFDQRLAAAQTELEKTTQLLMQTIKKLESK